MNKEVTKMIDGEYDTGLTMLDVMSGHFVEIFDDLDTAGEDLDFEQKKMYYAEISGIAKQFRRSVAKILKKYGLMKTSRNKCT